MEFLNELTGVPKPVGAYSQAVRVGDLVFCSGQIGIDPETSELESGGIEVQTKRVFSNIKAALEAVGSSIEKIAMATVFLTDKNHGGTVNELYGAFVNSEAAPARQTVVVKELPMGALIEISVIACVD